MAINRKKEFARMIAMMVRKESVSFEPTDRVRLDLERKSRSGGTVRYDVWEVYYDFDSGRMCYKLFTDGGLPVSKPSGPFFLDEDLTSAELSRVSAKVSDYVEKSIGRGMAIDAIEKIVFDAPEMTVSFAEKPRLFVDIERNGNLVAFSPDSIFDTSWAIEDRREVFLSGKTGAGKEISIPLFELSDMGLSVLYRNLSKSLKQDMSTSRDIRKPVSQGPSL